MEGAAVAEDEWDVGELHVAGVDAFRDALERAEKAGLGAEERDALAADHLRFDLQAAVYRWTVLAGEPPTLEAWDSRDAERAGWPTLDDVEAVFGDWERMLEESEIGRSRLAVLDAEMRAGLARARDAERSAQGARREAEKVRERERELRRQLERAAAKADVERAARQEAERAAEVARAAAVPAPARPAPTAAADPGELERLGEELARARERGDDLGRALTALRGHAEELERRLGDEQAERAVLRRALAPTPDDAREQEPAPAGPDPGDPWWGLRERLAALPEVGSVAEAVEAAAARAPHLEFAERAFSSARQSPFRDPGKILADLVKLDRVAELYARGAIGRPAKEVARDLGLDWVEGATAARHGQYGRHYRFRHAGRDWLLEPHLRTAPGAGAGAIARTYFVLHPGDDDHPRAVIVGHVGRKLPDSTTR